VFAAHEIFQKIWLYEYLFDDSLAISKKIHALVSNFI